MTVLEFIKQKHKVSGGHNGISLPSLMRITGLDLDSLKTELNRLYIEDKIIVRKGIHGKLIFKKVK